MLIDVLFEFTGNDDSTDKKKEYETEKQKEEEEKSKKRSRKRNKRSWTSRRKINKYLQGFLEIKFLQSRFILFWRNFRRW